MLKMTFFWLLFRGKFEQKTQKSISFKNQWRLKNIKKAMVVKNIIAEDMPFTKSIFEQFWRSYCKKTIFVVFHFLKFLPRQPQKTRENFVNESTHEVRELFIPLGGSGNWCHMSGADTPSAINSGPPCQRYFHTSWNISVLDFHSGLYFGWPFLLILFNTLSIFLYFFQRFACAKR